METPVIYFKNQVLADMKCVWRKIYIWTWFSCNFTDCISKLSCFIVYIYFM